MKCPSFFLALLVVLLLLLSLLDLLSALLPLWQQPSDLAMKILWDLRIPKLLTAILAGASLSMAGVLMQTLFRNPLAGPYILGVSSGAGLGVAIITMIGGMGVSWLASRYSMAFAAILGALAVMSIVLIFARRVRNNITLLIIGMMIGSIAGAFISLIQNFANPDALKLFIVWTFGSVASVGWNEWWVMLAVVLVGVVGIIGLVKPLNGLLLGEDYARNLGIPVERVRRAIIGVTCLLSGGITAFCGPIAFIGVAVPHLSRGLMRTSDHRIVVPAAALIGANMLVVCDIVCSLFTYPLPISTMSALLAAPVVIYIILRK